MVTRIFILHCRSNVGQIPLPPSFFFSPPEFTMLGYRSTSTSKLCIPSSTINTLLIFWHTKWGLNCRISNRQDSATFLDKGKEVPSLSQDKLKILLRDRTGWDSLSKSRTVRDFDSLSRLVPSRPVGQNGTEQKRTFYNRKRTF